MKIFFLLVISLLPSCLGRWNSKLNPQEKELIDHFIQLAKDGDTVKIKQIIVDQKNISAEIRLAHIILTNFEIPSTNRYKVENAIYENTIECKEVTISFTKKITNDPRIINGEIIFILDTNNNTDKIYHLNVGNNDVNVNGELPDLVGDSSSIVK